MENGLVTSNAQFSKTFAIIGREKNLLEKSVGGERVAAFFLLISNLCRYNNNCIIAKYNASSLSLDSSSILFFSP